MTGLSIFIIYGKDIPWQSRQFQRSHGGRRDRPGWNVHCPRAFYQSVKGNEELTEMLRVQIYKLHD